VNEGQLLPSVTERRRSLELALSGRFSHCGFKLVEDRPVATVEQPSGRANLAGVLLLGTACGTGSQTRAKIAPHTRRPSVSQEEHWLVRIVDWGAGRAITKFEKEVEPLDGRMHPPRRRHGTPLMTG